MRITSIFALIATASAADAAHGNDKNWAECTSASDCGDGFYCCTVTKQKDGSAPSASTKICTCKSQNGTVPTTATTNFVGYQYFCSSSDFKLSYSNISATTGAKTLASGLAGVMLLGLGL